MVKIKIDNIECEVPEGTTIMAAAKSLGIRIPALCEKDGLKHYSSCMVCLVKDNISDTYIPSCTALVQYGMDIDVSGESPLFLRKKAVELLLSEHRAECEAPCRIVCPARLNIPEMNRLLAKGNTEAAVMLSSEESDGEESPCTNCPAYCENACRRKKIDIPVSIRNAQLFIAGKIPHAKSGLYPERERKAKIATKRFTSLTGKLENEELYEWLKECDANAPRFREINTMEAASGESMSCMHCDCRASGDCRLRDLAEEFKIKDPRGKLVNAPAVKKINHQTNLIFENAKCIKCGLCVRVCEDNNDYPALCFINRGFVSIISEPLTCTFDETLKTRAKECIEVCPTGALAYYK